MILITGATGRSGAPAALRLAERGLPVRVLARNPAKAVPLARAGIEVAPGDVSDPEALRAAMQGVEKVAIILPNGEQQLAQEKAIVDAAKAAGAKHVVKISSMEAVPGARNPVHQAHWSSEEYIRASGLAWTMVRPNFYLQNFLGGATTIRDQGKFYLPFGDKGAACMTDARDAGFFVAHVLATPGHENRSYDVTGPEVLTFAQVAKIFSEVLGKPVQYVAVDPAAYRETLGRFIKSAWHLDAVCGIFEEIRLGYVAPPTDTFRQVTGRAPTDTRQFIRDHLQSFKP